jgi:hypothetical protein
LNIALGTWTKQKQVSSPSTSPSTSEEIKRVREKEPTQ